MVSDPLQPMDHISCAIRKKSSTISCSYLFLLLSTIFDHQILFQGMPYLLNLMRDQNMGVRDSVAWAMSRVCDQIPEAALDPANIENLLNALIENLDCEPRVATNVCWVSFPVIIKISFNAKSAEALLRFFAVSVTF